MRIALGADYPGFDYNHEVLDFGTQDATPVDYPSTIFALGEAIATGQVARRPRFTAAVPPIGSSSAQAPKELIEIR